MMIWHKKMFKACVEPEKRLIAGSLGWAVHRMPIKGGKTFEETVLKEDLSQPVIFNGKPHRIIDLGDRGWAEQLPHL